MKKLSKLYELQAILATVIEKAEELRGIEQDTLDTSTVAYELEKEASNAMVIVQKQLDFHFKPATKNRTIAYGKPTV